MKSEAKTSQLKARTAGQLNELGKKQRRRIMKRMGGHRKAVVRGGGDPHEC